MTKQKESIVSIGGAPTAELKIQSNCYRMATENTIVTNSLVPSTKHAKTTTSNARKPIRPEAAIGHIKQLV